MIYMFECRYREAFVVDESETEDGRRVERTKRAASVCCLVYVSGEKFNHSTLIGGIQFEWGIIKG